jgi:hypothetical protein
MAAAGLLEGPPGQNEEEVEPVWRRAVLLVARALRPSGGGA